MATDPLDPVNITEWREIPGPVKMYVGQTKRRHVPGHPSPDVPHESQYYACERPEDPARYGVLFHTDCPKCMIVLRAASAQPGGILMFHGGST